MEEIINILLKLEQFSRNSVIRKWEKEAIIIQQENETDAFEQEYGTVTGYQQCKLQ